MNDVLDIVSKLKEEKSSSKAIQESPFARIAYIMECGDSNGFQEELKSLLDASPMEIAGREMKNIGEDFKPAPKAEANIHVFPFYIARDVRKLPTISRIAGALGQNSWMVYFCNSKQDLLSAVVIQKTCDQLDVRELLGRYSIGTVAKYSSLRKLHDYSEAILGKMNLK